MPVFIYIAPDVGSGRRPGTRLDSFLRCWRSGGPTSICLQQWRILELLQPTRSGGADLPRSPRTADAIIVSRHGTRFPPAPRRLRAETRLQHLDQVFVDPSTLPASIGPRGGTDYAFVPGYDPDAGEGGYEANAARLLALRPQTRQLVVHSLADFVAALCGSELITEPIRHLVMVAHFAGTTDFLGVLLELPMGEAVPPAGSGIRYDDLDRVLNPRTAADRQLRDRLVIRESLLSPRPTDAYYREPQLHIRGCSVGRMPGFMQGLARVLGGHVRITGPKHLHYVSHLAGGGSFEWMAYQFTLLRPAPFDGTTVEQRLAQAREAFRRQAATDPTLRYHDGASIPAERWTEWIPERAPGSDDDLDVNNPGPPSPSGPLQASWTVSVPTPIPGARPQNLEARFWYFMNSTCYVLVRGLDADPSFGASDPQAARRQALADFCSAAPDYAAEHEFPRFARWGYRSLLEFLEGWTWQFQWSRQEIEGGGTEPVLIAQGTRHEYTVIQPIMNRTETPNRLIANFYPDASRPTLTVIEQIRADDPNLFATT